MRRSQAPSQLGARPAAKRFRINDVTGASLLSSVANSGNIELEKAACTTRSSQSVLELLENNNKNVDTSVSNSSQQKNNCQSMCIELSTENPSSVESVKQYSVFWCQASTKKNKNWEEEAILVVKDRGVTLKNMEGKEIGKAAGYKLAQLQDLEYGTILKVGGREVLIQDQIFESLISSETSVGKISRVINPKIDVKSSGTLNHPPFKKARIQKSQGVPLEVEHPPGLRSSQDVLDLLDNNQQNANTSLSSKCSPAKNSSYPIQSAIEQPLLKALKQYNVFWCKASAKKHKNWEEEGILTVKDRGVILKSMEGKEISRATGFKFAQLQELEHGNILKVGGREVLIQNQIIDSVNISGNCSSPMPCGTQLQADGASSLVNPRPPNKEFVSPFLQTGKKAPKLNSTSNEIKPRYNPSHPSALVMPRPPVDIQKESQRGTVIVDVVVDPLLSKNLRPHQRDGVVFLYECLMGFKTPNMYGAILADEMGLGKTLQCITLIWILLQQGPYNGRPTIQRVLIITPSSLVKNWEKEFRRWLGRERINVFTADQQTRPIEFLKRPLCPVMVVSYEMLVRCFDEVQQVNFDLVVCDEGHRLKNAGNKTSSLLSQLDTNRKVLLTGTPVQNDLKEFFTLADFVNPGILGSLSAFRRIYEEPIVALQQPECDEDTREIGEGCASELAHLTSQFVLRRTQEVMNAHLPPKVESVIFCKPTYIQIELYRSLLDSSAVRSILSSTHCGNNQLSFILALRKLCNHPTLFTTTTKRSEESKTNEDEESDIEDFECSSLLQTNYKEKNPQIQSPDASGKFVVTYAIVDSVMKNTKEKIILVSYSTKMLDLFGETCTERNYSFLRLDGSTQTSSRMGLVDRFNDPHGTERIFLLSSKAGGVGLNLIGASRLILYDIDWNPANDMQAMARVWREGQKRKVKIYRLLTTGTIEEKIFQRQILKQGLSGTIVDTRDSTQGHFTKEELKDLFTLREDTNCDTHDLIDCPCTQKGQNETLPGLDDYDFEDERECQLGARSSKRNELHKTVDQLMDWEHFGVPFSAGSFEDVCLESALEDISFVFRCASGTNMD
ncbi:DNA repair and recombination protein RAD54B isoform X2 [Daphnia magna]|uniref:DNA repair and recombination protein RAD54B isoform X2 n=1 Tax=Daphnia magna TaxID=35525 RepID=UPI001E1BA7C2|nr:DNA repair and recombination protein RAD54B isoform X2 [Daphnia magna]